MSSGDEKGGAFRATESCPFSGLGKTMPLPPTEQNPNWIWHDTVQSYVQFNHTPMWNLEAQEFSRNIPLAPPSNSLSSPSFVPSLPHCLRGLVSVTSSTNRVVGTRRRKLLPPHKAGHAHTHRPRPAVASRRVPTMAAGHFRPFLPATWLLP